MHIFGYKHPYDVNHNEAAGDASDKYNNANNAIDVIDTKTMTMIKDGANNVNVYVNDANYANCVNDNTN